MKYIAFVTKGIEAICAKELSLIEGLTVISIQSKQSKYVRFEYTDNPLNLSQLKTIDDVALLLGDFSLQDIMDLKIELNVVQQDFIPFISKFRSISNNFSVTLSNYKSNINKEELKLSLQKYFSNRLNLSYSELDHSNLDFRINIEEDTAFISLKLFPESLYKRSYNHTTTLGSIRSTIASAIILEILNKLNKKPNCLSLVDNFCGSGTFLCEASLMGFNVFGGDIKPSSVTLTKKNLVKAGLKNVEIKLQNAEQTKWQNNYFDIAVSNFPWNKQISESNLSKLYDKSIKEYARILKKDSSFGFIGMKPDLIKKYIKIYFPNYEVEEFKIGYLGQNPTILICYL